MKISKGRKDKAAILLAHGTKITDVAAAVGVNRKTIQRWLADDGGFREQVEELRAESLGQLKSLLAQAAPAAASVLSRVMMGDVEIGEVKVNEKIRAADALLKHLGNWLVSSDVLVYGERLGRELDKALKLVSPQAAQKIREALAHGLYRAGVSESGITPIVSGGGERGGSVGDGGDNINPDTGED